jgi:uncharacterized protein (DUF4415 family)
MKKMTKAQAEKVELVLETLLERGAEPIPELEFTADEWDEWFENLPPSGTTAPEAAAPAPQPKSGTRKISIRISERLIEAYKDKAKKQGMTYQAAMKVALRMQADADRFRSL